MPVYRGPQPYTELDEDYFRGRTREIDELADLVSRNRLSILTAPSGVGKTSLVLAGLVPFLRRRYEEELHEGDIVFGPTLVCRSWSGSARRPPDKILMDAIRAAVDELEDPKRTLFLLPKPSYGALLLDQL